MQYVHSSECKEADKYVELVCSDPMTSGMGAPVGDILDGYLKRHIKNCKKCKEATIEANTP